MKPGTNVTVGATARMIPINPTYAPGQAFDQLKLYGSFAKWFVEVGNPAPGTETAVHFRALACRAWQTALGGRAGVVHLNFPLREPLAPVSEPVAGDWEGRPDGGPW